MTSRRSPSCAAAAFLLLVACNKKDRDGGSEPPVATPPSAPAKAPTPIADKDCATIDGDAAAAILGVPKARPTPYAGHQKLPPDNMDVFACSYVDASPDPAGPTLQYTTFSPIPADVASVWQSHETGRHERMQSFAPNVGDASAGWVSDNARPAEFGAVIAFRTANKIFEVQVSRLRSAEAAKSGAVKAATILQKAVGSG